MTHFRVIPIVSQTRKFHVLLPSILVILTIQQIAIIPYLYRELTCVNGTLHTYARVFTTDASGI